jgi:hypothetical protein
LVALHCVEMQLDATRRKTCYVVRKSNLRVTDGMSRDRKVLRITRMGLDREMGCNGLQRKYYILLMQEWGNGV